MPSQVAEGRLLLYSLQDRSPCHRVVGILHIELEAHPVRICLHEHSNDVDQLVAASWAQCQLLRLQILLQNLPVLGSR